MEKWRSEFSFFIPIKIRFSETDMFGHVNNVSPFIYFEEARIEFLKSMSVFDDIKQEDTSIPVVADLQCDYHKQMFFDDYINLFVKANYVGSTSIDIHYMALDKDEQVSLTGRGRLVYVEPKTGNPISLTDSMKEELLQV
ncbi:acyl-CoA thioester hydrolase [Virgibacillus natechei]|uniref:Acyl-CoA thioester hydrolase n=2 Tax=Virgibacillus natechei TaxID=1216297 RepID=A0ABS4IFL7_9BACI|nr:acyl-CoA thioester hydrolase [Virgibacillus natechei]